MGSSWASLLSFVTKAGTETLKITQEEIIKLFLRNENVDVLSVDELLKIHIESLANIVSCLSAKKLKKEFREVVFNEIIRQPQLFEEHLSLISQMFEHLQVERTFRLKLTLIPEIDVDFYVKLIEVVSAK